MSSNNSSTESWDDPTDGAIDQVAADLAAEVARLAQDPDASPEWLASQLAQGVQLDLGTDPGPATQDPGPAGDVADPPARPPAPPPEWPSADTQPTPALAHPPPPSLPPAPGPAATDGPAIDQIAVRKLGGFNFLSVPQWTVLPRDERARLVKGRLVQFLSEGEEVPVRTALQWLQQQAKAEAGPGDPPTRPGR